MNSETSRNESASTKAMDMKLEVVVVPVTDDFSVLLRTCGSVDDRTP
jgi:hypothetical protein